MSLDCLDMEGVKTARSGVRGVVKMLPASLPFVSIASEDRFLLDVRLRKPETVDWNDRFEDSEGVRGDDMWKLDEDWRVWIDEAGVASTKFRGSSLNIGGTRTSAIIPRWS